MKKIIIVIFLGSILLGCKESIPVATDEEKEIRTVTKDDFGEERTLAVELAEGFDLKLWAPGQLLSNAVAISFDNHGIAYVSETSRRKSSDIDIRQHRDWMTEDLALQSLDDTEAFHKRKLDPGLSDQNTWQEDFNKDGSHDYKDLMVQTEYIRRIIDVDQDGRADRSELFANSFNDMLTGVGAGVMYFDDHVYLTAAPDLWKLKDTNGDDRADQQESISHGYGIHIAYAGHDMSGLTVGPDGKIYWSIGDLGINATSKEGINFKYPNQGGVMRCNPDGSDMEVFAHGLRNPQEIAFNAWGDLISVDNDGDHAGEHERFVHILEGSDSGWRINWQFGKYNQPNEGYKVWMDEKLHIPHFEGQAAYLLPPLALAPDGPAGLAYNPGTALGEAWNDYFFASYFKGSAAKSKTQAFKLKPKGATYEIENTKDIINGIASTGVNFGPDGALYINDWKDGYALKSEGRIWKLDVSSEKNAQRAETQKILQEGMSGRNAEELNQLLGHNDMRVRQAVQFELVKTDNVNTLLDALKGNGSTFKKLHAVWGLGQLSLNQVRYAKFLLDFLKDDDAHVRAQIAKVLGENRYAPAFSELLKLLKDQSARVQLHAAEALGKIRNPNAFHPLIDLLEETGDRDPHLRHAIMYALSKLNSEVNLARLNRHSSVDVRIGAVVALRHMKSKRVATFLKDYNPLVMTEAARAVHDDFSIPSAMSHLAKALKKPDNLKPERTEAFLRRAINANLRIGDEASAERLAAFIADRSNPEAMRADAMWALGYWENPPVLDRVEGRYRGAVSTNLVEAQNKVKPHVNALLSESIVNIKAATAALIGRIKLKGYEDELYTFVKSNAQPALVRMAALEALAQLDAPQVQTALDAALTSKEVSLREKAQTLLGTLDMDESVAVQLLAKAIKNGTTGEQQKALLSLSAKKSTDAKGLLGKWMSDLVANKVAPELQLDVLEAIEKSNFDDLKKMSADYEAAKDQDDVLALYKESIYGGNRGKGGRIFYQNNSAQCIRCHIHNEMGGEVGPDLSNIASILSPGQLLESLLDPNSRIAPGYGTVVLGLTGEQKISGILLEENDQFLTIRNSDGEAQQIAKAEIMERENMPSGMFSMKGILSKTEIRDLMAFLTSLK